MLVRLTRTDSAQTGHTVEDPQQCRRAVNQPNAAWREFRDATLYGGTSAPALVDSASTYRKMCSVKMNTK